MKILIDACPLLTSLQYVAAFDGLSNPVINTGITIHELLEVLDTLKTTLEELYLEINFTDYRMSHRMPRLTSLCHFTALRVLDTAARMWELFLFVEQETDEAVETMRGSLDGIDCEGLDIQLGLQSQRRLTLRPVFQAIPTPVIEWTDEKYTSA
jgi:hypothetical protein